MEQYKNTIATFLHDQEGYFSSKRVITFLAFLVMLGCVIAALVMGKEIARYIWDGLVYIVLGGFGTSTAERFGKPQSSDYTEPSTE